MKYLYIICILFFSIQTNAQDYIDLMQKQKEIFAQENNINIVVDQQTFKEGELVPEFSFQTKIQSSGMNMLWETPSVVMVQNEKALLMIRETEEIMMYSPFDQSVNSQLRMDLGLEQWQIALDRYIEAAIKMESSETNTQWIFTIDTKEKRAKKAIISFDKKSELMVAMEIDQELIPGENSKINYQFSYDFKPINSSNFDLGNYLQGTNKEATGIGKYENFELVYQPIQ